MRVIDADALKEKLGDTRDGEPVFRHTEFIRMDVLEEAIDKAPTIKTFTLADIEEQYRKGLEKGLEEAEPKKCPICGNDLYEYCFMCCYEGKKVRQNDTRRNSTERCL